MGADEGAATEFKVAREAQLKILLHGAKHPSSDVCGALIGKVDGACVTVADAVPFFHSTMLTPTLETGFLLTEEYCKSAQTPEGTKIVGWYHGPSRANFNGVPKTASVIANKVQSALGGPACLVLIDNGKLDDETYSGLQVLSKKTGATAWTPSLKFSFVDTAASAEFTKLLRAEAQTKLVDLDSWLEDTTLDFRNLDLLK